MLQKYHFADLSNAELRDLYDFSIEFLMDRNTHKKLDWQAFILWKKKVNCADFLNEFYAKYTLFFQNSKCSDLLKMLKKHLPDYLLKKVGNLLPECDRL